MYEPSAKNEWDVQNFVPTNDDYFLPDADSLLWIGTYRNPAGSVTQGCKCRMAHLRFYLKQFVNDREIMNKYSEFGIGKTHPC